MNDVWGHFFFFLREWWVPVTCCRWDGGSRFDKVFKGPMDRHMGIEGYGYKVFSTCTSWQLMMPRVGQHRRCGPNGHFLCCTVLGSMYIINSASARMEINGEKKEYKVKGEVGDLGKECEEIVGRR